MPPNRDTPAMRQYDAFKRQHPDCLLFFRMGDFYELFDEDAVRAHKALGITLTQRTEGIPMAGVPYHSAESYLRRLIQMGIRVAVCDQVQDPREARASGSVIERAVTRVLTPGTLVDETLLDESASNTVAALCFHDAGDTPAGRVGLAIVELSTGAFTLLDCRADQLTDELARRSVCEIIFAEAATTSAPGAATPPRVARLVDALAISSTPRPAWHFRPAEALESLRSHFGVSSLAGFGLTDEDPAVPAAGAVIRYLSEVQALEQSGRATSEGMSSGSAPAFLARPRSLAHLRPPRREDASTFLTLDAVSLRALEVERTLRAARAGTPQLEGSLAGLFLCPPKGARGLRTSMGKRLVQEWLRRPLAERAAIEARHACVAAFVSDTALRDAVDAAIEGVQDVPRIAARMTLGRATPRDLAALGRSVARAAALAAALRDAPSFAHAHASIERARQSLEPLARAIADACVDDPPAHLREGGLIRPGVDPALDEARTIRSDSGRWLADYQARLAQEHDLPSLKVGFNKIFGFFIELPAAQSRRAPAQFTRRQTLKGAERYITPELKQHEDKVLTAEDRALQREQQLFLALCARAAQAAADCAAFADTVAELDVLLAFASRAARRGWTRPAISDEPVLCLRQARHPVLEEILGDRFVPNDCTLGQREQPSDENPAAPLALITGPNMAGKSTYIRMVALCVLLAHAGSFVPAHAATIGITDRIFTRIGADDALHAGQSTFMVEMIETASILHHAGPRSLVILDEIGRGTSTLDGLSLAWAIAEHLAGHTAAPPAPPQPRTLFATHYHELTALEERLPARARNLHVAVREWEGQVIFLHRILPGRASRSYGIHVARLAGLPKPVVTRAGELLQSLTVSHQDPAGPQPAPTPTARRPAPDGQLSLFREFIEHPAVAELKQLELDTMTPLQAFDALRSLRQRATTTEPHA